MSSQARSPDPMNTPARSSADLENAHEKTNLEVPHQTPRDSVSTVQWILTLIGLYLGALLYGLDTTVAADVQSAVFETFQDIPNLPWVGIGFPMASVAVILPLGRFYGLFNIKVLILSGVVLFEAGSALCGGAPSSVALIVGRVIAGIGGAALYIGALNYISVYSEPKMLPLYNALIGLSWGVGAILGPVVGGAFSVSSATWRWAFYINLPLAGILSPVYIFSFPSWSPAPDVPIMQKLRSFDWIGSVLNGAMFVIFMIALTFSGSTYPWSSGSAIALWVIFGVVLVVYAIQQYFCIFTTPEHRIFPVHFLKSRDMLLLYVATAASAAVNAVTLYYIPLYFTFSRGDSALEAAVRLLPFIIIFIFSVMLAGGSLPAVGRYAPFYTVGAVLALPGAALLFTLRADTSVAKVYGFEVLVAAGTGLVFQNAYAIASAKVPDHDKPNAIGFINVAQIGTIAIALSIAASLFENLGFRFLEEALSPYGLPEEIYRAALAGTDSSVITALGPEIAQKIIETVAYTISRVFGMGIAGAALMLITSLLMKQEKLNLTAAAGM